MGPDRRTILVRRGLQRLALVAIGLMLACAILEFVSRAAPGLLRLGAVRSLSQLKALRSQEANRFKAASDRRSPYRRLADERISKIGVPDVQYHVFGLDFTSTVQYNSLGIRDREPDQLAGVPKILLLGDSFVEGKGVAASETISAVLEAELRARGGEWAVVNAGVDGTAAQPPQVAYPALK